MFTKGETAVSIKTMLETVRDHNPAVQNTHVVIIDKDFAEVGAIKDALPHVQIHLCVVHVLKAIRKEIMKTVQKEAQREVYSIVHSLVYAQTSTKFDSTWNKLDKYPVFKQYMDTHWLPVKAWWVFYERACYVNLGNTTNNRIESQFGKLKQVVTRKSRMNECVRLLLSIVMSADVQDKYKQYKMRYKVAYANGYSGAGAGYFGIVSPYAAKKIIDQLSRADCQRYTTQQQGNQYQIVNKKYEAQYCVSDDATVCTCAFHRTMLLSCRHIFLVRQNSAQSIVTAELVAMRWHLESSDRSGAVASSSPAVQLLGMPCPTNSRTLSKAEKYTAACKQMRKIASIMSEVGLQEFLSMTSFLARVKTHFEAGKECYLLEDDDDAEDDVEDQNAVHITDSSEGYVLLQQFHMPQYNNPLHVFLQQLYSIVYLQKCSTIFST